MKKLLVIHPFLFALFPILFYYSHNKEELYLNVLTLPLAVAVVFTLICYSLLSFILKDGEKAGLLVSFFLLLFFSYGHFIELIFPDGHFLNLFKFRLLLGNFVIGPNKFLFLFWIIIFILGAYLIVRTQRDLRNPTMILNIVALFLVVITVVNIGRYEFKRRAISQDRSTATKVSNEEIGDLESRRKTALSYMPDIYYIIFDSYASSSTLKEFYNFDNSNFTNYLIKKGFFVASKSRANHPTTRFSLASSLNMKYLNYLKDELGEESKDVNVIDEMLQNYKVWVFLKARGYKFIHFESGWVATDYNKYADLSFRYGRLNEFRSELVQTTMLRVAPFVNYLINDDRRQRVLYALSKLAEVYRIEGPKFVFAHMTPPHPPWLFGANGEPGPQHLEMSVGSRKERENYINQLIFINKKIRVLVDEILSKSKVQPIIILQADHGPSLTFTGILLGNIKERPTEDNLKERMRIFNAYYLPKGRNAFLYDSISPVNTFRLIFNLYFGTNYELLDDQSYYSTYEHPYRFVNVTDKVKYD